MAKPELNLDGPWIDQLDEWVRQQPKPLPFSIDAVDRARYGITVLLTGMPDMPPHSEKITVRHVITKTRDELLALEQVGPKTMEVVDAFLEAHNITELGPANASQ